MSTVEQLTAATTGFAELVADVQPTSLVPSCPGWTVADLVDHLGGVHQWARHAVAAGDPDGKPIPATAGMGASGLAEWYAGHARDLVATLTEAGDGPAWIFGDGPATGRWWVRRQLHETLMHSRDLLGASGREADWEIDPSLAWDGVDEVATMFYPRQVRLGRTEPLTAALRVTAADLPDAPPITIGDGTATVELVAPAADVLLMLWGRAAMPANVAGLVDGHPITP